MQEKNPFNPSFGKVPSVFIDREELAQSIIEGLKQLDGPYQTTMISGVRGMGKTVLFSDICSAIQQDSDWIVADIPSHGNIVQAIINAVHVYGDSKLKKSIESLDGISLSVFGIELSVSKKNQSDGLQFLLENVLQKLQKQNKKLLIAIDEVQSSKSMREFASIYQFCLRRNYPIACLMTGLPKNLSELQNDPVLTFLLRSMRIDLPLLSRVSVYYSYKQIFSEHEKEISEQMLQTMVFLTNGYSYAFQLLGYLIWNLYASVNEPKTEMVLDEYKRLLYRNAYSKIYDELSEMDREFVKAMAKCEATPVPMKYISRQMNKKPNYISTYRTRLLEAGVIQSVSYGYVAFTLPLFKDYILEFHSEQFWQQELF